MSIVDEIVGLFDRRGDSEYGGEAVTQAEHALQTAALAEAEQASPALIASALLHDVGHLLHDLTDDSPDRGIDDHHEHSGYHFLRKHFPASVCDPVRLHVPAKRYLCSTVPEYHAALSGPSQVSFRLQGGEMDEDEIMQFENEPFWQQAIRLRRWDDEAKVVGLETPTVRHFARYLQEVALPGETS